MGKKPELPKFPISALVWFAMGVFASGILTVLIVSAPRLADGTVVRPIAWGAAMAIGVFSYFVSSYEFTDWRDQRRQAIEARRARLANRMTRRW